MSFLGSLFGGSNPTLNNAMGSVGSNAGFASSTGQSDTSSASSFYKTLLSGNMGDISKLLAPQIGEVAKQGQQQKQTLSNFGNRSGGTNASVQAIGQNQRSTVNDMISKLTSGAAGSLASMGQNLLGQGTSAYGLQADMSQNQMQNWQNSILGKGISGAIGSAEGFGLGKAFPG